MKQNLKNMSKGSYSGKMPSQDELENMVRNVDSNTVKDVQSVVDRYSGKSESELLSELKKITNNEKQAGNLTNEGIENVAKNLEAMLDDQQRRRLHDIMRQLKG